MKKIELTLEQLIEILRVCTADHVHIYIPFEDLIVHQEINDKCSKYKLIDKHAPMRGFIQGREYLSVYISSDLSWIRCDAFSKTNHFAAIEKIKSYLK